MILQLLNFVKHILDGFKQNQWLRCLKQLFAFSSWLLVCCSPVSSAFSRSWNCWGELQFFMGYGPVSVSGQRTRTGGVQTFLRAAWGRRGSPWKRPGLTSQRGLRLACTDGTGAYLPSVQRCQPSVPLLCDSSVSSWKKLEFVATYKEGHGNFCHLLGPSKHLYSLEQ